MDLGSLSDLELEALRELGNIGAGHAATSLSQMLGKTVEMSVPMVRVVEISKIHEVIDVSKIVSGVVTGLNDLENGETGYLYVVFPEETEKRIAEMMMLDGDMIESALMEIGNILSSSFCDAMAEMLGTMLIPTPPSFAKDYSVAILDALLAQLATKGDHVVIFDTELKDEDGVVNIEILLLPSENFMGYIARMISMVE
ncbi:chemotaxis protein CheC [Archaeoglobus profundus]|uniref:CheC, inhibitor of MCP methylation n=1 Tax=Archaeoglobus profundus (strain DSM 5631 / JCM 9629 / NBRC 100127 / Av18) TaxID=572546 RepID=D2RE78_ARCPA|nr:chemotaxis protein CheC [Archaeoglobus profundus]ADB58422.1 CheC, inhibitor of MCP methylation [Archaeoglobus profundus DSM 5631]